MDKLSVHKVTSTSSLMMMVLVLAKRTRLRRVVVVTACLTDFSPGAAVTNLVPPWLSVWSVWGSKLSTTSLKSTQSTNQ